MIVYIFSFPLLTFVSFGRKCDQNTRDEKMLNLQDIKERSFKGPFDNHVVSDQMFVKIFEKNWSRFLHKKL